MNAPTPAEVTKLLLAWSAGDGHALEQLLPVVYRELHRMARRYMAGERPDHTLQASALVNEAYLKLVDVRQMQWQNRAHFFGVSAELMRRILVDFGRRRHYLKRGGGVRPETLNEDLMMTGTQTTNLVALDDALKTLAAVDPRRVRERFCVGPLGFDQSFFALIYSAQITLSCRDGDIVPAVLSKL